MLLNQARNEQELLNLIMPDLKKAMDYTIQKIWNDNRELIRTIVYESYQPEAYQRTGEFKEAWVTDTKAFRNVVKSELKFDPRLLEVNYDKWQHGSKVLEEPMTTYLAEVIYQGKSGDFFGEGPWRRKRDVWEELNKRLGKRKLEKYFEEGMTKYGIPFRRRKSVLEVKKYEE